MFDEGGADASHIAEEHMFGKSEGSLTHTHTHTHTHTPRPSNSAMCQSYSHVGTVEVDLINFPFIQTANYTLTHTITAVTAQPRQRGANMEEKVCNKHRKKES